MIDFSSYQYFVRQPQFKKIDYSSWYNRYFLATTPTANMAKNFGLSRQAFDDLVQSLQQGNEALFEQIFLYHFQDCRQFIRNKYQCADEEAYDASMETLLIFRKKLIQGKIQYGNLRFLFTRMAGQVLFKWREKWQKEKNLPFNPLQNLPEENPEEFEVLSKAWEKLGDACKNLLKQFYYDRLSLKEIAANSAKNYAAIRKQKERCVDHLRTLFFQYSKTH